jgi:signal transduction histidine kinase
MEESFIEEMKRYLSFTEEDCRLLRELGPRMEKYFPELAERFYSQIPHHPSAFRVFAGGEQQIARLKHTLQEWARGLFTGTYDSRYAEDRYQIGYRHVRIGLEQKYVISAMGIVRAFLSECLLLEFAASDIRLRHNRSLNKILDLDLNLMCESYMHATMQNLRALNDQLERANRELAEAGRVKDDFLARTSHELRTPLNSILGFTKLILDGLCKSRKEEEELLRDVFASARHLLGLVNDLLDIARIEADQMTLHLEEVNPRHVLDSTLPLVSVLAASKGLDLQDTTTSMMLPLVRADEVRLRQVLLNLLSNAVKFTPQGRVLLRALTILPHSVAGTERSCLRIEVEDTGIGISEENRAVVFDKFVQVDSMQARREPGSGLGLAIARRLVEMMGGAIGLDSGPGGRGTLVWFTIPLAAEPPQQSATGIRAAPDKREGRSER